MKRYVKILLELWWKFWQIQISLENVDTYVVPILQYKKQHELPTFYNESYL